MFKQQPRLRILIVDDIGDVRRDLRVLLQIAGNFEVVGEAADGHGAIEQLALLRPDVVVMDLSMPGLGGLQAAPRMKAESPECRVVALTVHSDEVSRQKAIAAGFDAFVVKGTPLPELLDAIAGNQSCPSPSGGAS
ncbi:MAG TPA: response regulator transcription factor [Thermoleophilia bacterium]|nr:response regulator transcription factor [Thermoleophilia bacterium]